MQMIEAQCSWSWRLTITSISNMCKRWAGRPATQITRLWAAEGYDEGMGVAMQIAGYGVPIRSVLAPLGGAVLTDSRARRRDWPGGQASGLAFLERGPLPCGENPVDWAVRVGVVTADRAGGHGIRQQSSQRLVGGGNTVNRLNYRLSDG